MRSSWTRNSRAHWPNEDAIGKGVWLPWGDKSPTLRVVGVVRRVKVNELSEQGGFVQAYLPFLQGPSQGMAVVMKTALAPEKPIYDARTLAEIRDNSISRQRLNLTLLGIFASAALVLAVIGLYGVAQDAVKTDHRQYQRR